MKITYDKQTDALYIKFNNNKIIESEEVEQNVVIDFDNNDSVVGKSSRAKPTISTELLPNHVLTNRLYNTPLRLNGRSAFSRK